jgi:hypothetical protein
VSNREKNCPGVYRTTWGEEATTPFDGFMEQKKLDRCTYWLSLAREKVNGYINNASGLFFLNSGVMG